MFIIVFCCVIVRVCIIFSNHILSIVTNLMSFSYFICFANHKIEFYPFHYLYDLFYYYLFFHLYYYCSLY